MKKLIVIIGFIGFLGGLYWAVTLGLFAQSPAQKGSDVKVVFEVKKGMLPTSLTQRLEAQGLVSDVNRFKRLGQVLGKWKSVKAGEYELSPAMTPLEIFAVLESGISVTHPLVVQEGLNHYQIADELERQGLGNKAQFLALCKDPALMRALGFSDPLPPSLEGYLFPDTYHFVKNTDSREIIRVMVARFKEVFTPEFEARARAMGFTRHEFVTLASIIEKETGAPSDRFLISSVFHNRLKKRMPLQSDPTAIYGVWESFNGNIKREHLRLATPFNTYTIPRLPAGPISNPGQAALEATFNPAPSQYLYFVSRNDGTTQFSETLKAHNQAVQKFQLNSSARAGKSWRDLNKKSKNN